MGLLKNLSILALGAAAGFTASRIQRQSNLSTDIELKNQQELNRALPKDSSVARFFDSKYGKPFQSIAVSTIKFAATVKSGMQEKELEIQEKLERQKQDVRPGALDQWSVAEPTSHPTKIFKTSKQPSEIESPQSQRLERDRELGKDFFTP